KQQKGFAREVYFQAPSDASIQIRCNFVEFGELAEVPVGDTSGAYLISGEFLPYSDGRIVELSKCEFLGAITQQSAVTPSRFPEPMLAALGERWRISHQRHAVFMQGTCDGDKPVESHTDRASQSSVHHRSTSSPSFLVS